MAQEKSTALSDELCPDNRDSQSPSSSNESTLDSEASLDKTCKQLLANLSYKDILRINVLKYKINGLLTNPHAKADLRTGIEEAFASLKNLEEQPEKEQLEVKSCYMFYYAAFAKRPEFHTSILEVNRLLQSTNIKDNRVKHALKLFKDQEQQATIILDAPETKSNKLVHLKKANKRRHEEVDLRDFILARSHLVNTNIMGEDYYTIDFYNELESEFAKIEELINEGFALKKLSIIRNHSEDKRDYIFELEIYLGAVGSYLFANESEKAESIGLALIKIFKNKPRSDQSKMIGLKYIYGRLSEMYFCSYHFGESHYNECLHYAKLFFETQSYERFDILSLNIINIYMEVQMKIFNRVEQALEKVPLAIKLINIAQKKSSITPRYFQVVANVLQYIIDHDLNQYRDQALQMADNHYELFFSNAKKFNDYKSFSSDSTVRFCNSYAKLGREHNARLLLGLLKKDGAISYQRGAVVYLEAQLTSDILKLSTLLSEELTIHCIEDMHFVEEFVNQNTVWILEILAKLITTINQSKISDKSDLCMVLVRILQDVFDINKDVIQAMPSNYKLRICAHICEIQLEVGYEIKELHIIKDLLIMDLDSGNSNLSPKLIYELFMILRLGSCDPKDLFNAFHKHFPDNIYYYYAQTLYVLEDISRQLSTQSHIEESVAKQQVSNISKLYEKYCEFEEGKAPVSKQILLRLIQEKFDLQLDLKNFLEIQSSTLIQLKSLVGESDSMYLIYSVKYYIAVMNNDITCDKIQQLEEALNKLKNHEYYNQINTDIRNIIEAFKTQRQEYKENKYYVVPEAERTKAEEGLKDLRSSMFAGSISLPTTKVKRRVLQTITREDNEEKVKLKLPERFGFEIITFNRNLGEFQVYVKIDAKNLTVEESNEAKRVLYLEKFYGHNSTRLKYLSNNEYELRLAGQHRDTRILGTLEGNELNLSKVTKHTRDGKIMR